MTRRLAEDGSDAPGGHPRSTRTLILLHACRLLVARDDNGEPDIKALPGPWRNRENIVRECMRIVPNGEAVRMGEESRTNHFYGGREWQPRQYVRAGGVHLVGARRFVQDALRQKCIEVDRTHKNRKKWRMRLLYIPRPIRSYGWPDPIDFSREESAHEQVRTMGAELSCAQGGRSGRDSPAHP